ncbi:MAG: strawberry notch family protein, partial [Alphaproteobacteria bacterium]|nr:strawberry notch family protein [Alphaproteobacteria bacterium]
MPVHAVTQTSSGSPLPPSVLDGDLFSHAPEVQRPNGHQQRAARLIAVAENVLTVLCRGEAVTTAILRAAMEAAFDGSDAQGLWAWKDAYEAQELATLLFVRKYRGALAQREPLARLATLEKLQSLLATHTRRSDVSQRWQQFSTPLPLGFVVAEALKIGPEDVVLEPSAGTGLLAGFAEGARALRLNELEPGRRNVLKVLFPDIPVSDHNAEYIDDLLPRGFRPSAVIMNPPFSTSPTMAGTSPAVAGRHVFSALRRLAEGGRLAVITGRNFAPDSPKWREAFVRLQGIGRVVFSVPLAGSLYAKHGTSFETRLTVIDKRPAENPRNFSAYVPDLVGSAADLLKLVLRQVPERLPVDGSSGETAPVTALVLSPTPAPEAKKPEPITITDGLPLTYAAVDWAAPDGELRECLYEAYAPQSVVIEGAGNHPTPLVQSAAMASVAPPKPSYVPTLPKRLVDDGVLSDAQLESVTYAGEAHERLLPGEWAVNRHFDLAGESEVEADEADEDGEARDGENKAVRSVRFRQGWFLGDGTGCGKGRQVAGIILDNRLKGRTKAVWVSKNDKLLEDARRDWAALGGDPDQVVPLSKFKQGQPIDLADGILFLTYGTLRSGARQGKASRLDQIVEWLGDGFDGPLMFDESHALANATSEKGERGVKAASAQGQAGLRLQRAVPNARVVYVSATGATHVSNLAYAERLGLWGEETAFATR